MRRTDQVRYLAALMRSGRRSRLLRGSVASATMQIVEVGAKFLFNVILARVAGATGTGVFYAAFSLATLAATVGRLGQDRTVLRSVPALLAQGRTADARSVAARGLWITVLCSTAVATIVLVTSFVVARFVDQSPELTDSIRILALAIVPLSVLTVLAGVLRALRRIWASQFVLSAAWPLLACAGLLALGSAATSPAIAWVQLAAMVLTAAIGGVLFARALGPRTGPAGHHPYTDLLGSGREMCLVALLNTGVQWLPTLLLGLFVAASQVGVFALSNRVAVLAAFAPTAVNWMAAPMIAAAHGRSDTAAVERLAQRTTVLSMAFGLPVVLSFLLVPQLVLQVFGSDFADGARVLQVLAAGYAVAIVSGPVGIVLNMTGHERELRGNVSVAFALTMIASCVLMPWLGALGAGIAVATGMIVQNVLGVLSVRSKLGVRTVPVAVIPLLDTTK